MSAVIKKITISPVNTPIKSGQYSALNQCLSQVDAAKNAAVTASTFSSNASTYATSAQIQASYASSFASSASTLVANLSGFTDYLNSGGTGSGFNKVEISSNYTAKSSDMILANVATSNLTITAPVSGMFWVIDSSKKCSVNNITISRFNSSHKISGYQEDYILDVDRANILFIWDSTNSNWIITNNT